MGRWTEDLIIELYSSAPAGGSEIVKLMMGIYHVYTEEHCDHEEHD
jgi:hypothetical protein